MADEPPLDAAEPKDGVRGRITFDPNANDGRQPQGGTPSRMRSASRRRSRSRDSGSSRSRLPASPVAGIRIEYRTLSIQVSESRRVEEDRGADSKAAAAKKDDQDYFANLSFHEVDVDQLCQQLNVAQDAGLSEHAASQRLARDGKNTLPRPKTNYLKKILLYLFGGFCSILWIGVIVFFVCWKPLSNPPSPTNLALAILVIIWSTQRTMKSILGLMPSETLVLRDGALSKRPTADLVSSDVVHLKMGNRVPADMRVVSHSGDLRFDRSMLTGEPEEIEGTVDATDSNILESRNIALMGTMVVNGGGVGVVILTGSRSVMGRIAKATANAKERVPLVQQEIWRFVRIIVVLTVVLALLILLTWVGWLRKDHYGYMNVVAMLNDVMGCVVAFIPEGMPVAVALTLMLVAKRMKAADILPKGLTTVETLGCVNVICSDKTGTLTQNQMRVSSAAFVDRPLHPADLTRMLEEEDEADPAAQNPSLARLRQAALLCNDATFDPTTLALPVDDRAVQGNATDAAVLRWAAAGKNADDIVAASPRLFQIAFNSTNKWMLTMHPMAGHDHDHEKAGAGGSPVQVFVKGAPDVLLPACTKYWSGTSNSVAPLDDAARAAVRAYQDQLSSNAERVIVLCEKVMHPVHARGTNALSDEVALTAMADLTLVGILGITDPPRPETAHTVAECRRAGARFFMVTGDYSLTAAAIARAIGIFTGDRAPDTLDAVQWASATRPEELRRALRDGAQHSLLLDGAGIVRLSAADWDVVCEYGEIVFARTTPEQKLRIVNELRQRDNVVAVTGDGVNDAPALRAADVGVAVVGGSDVAIEAADLVLLDRFSAIVDAVRLGRLVFQNLQKVISYLLPAGSWSEIWPVLVNVFFGVPLPLSAFLMIVVCVFTDLFLSLSLIMEKEEFDLLSLPPRNHKRDHLITAKIYIQAYLVTGTMETCAAHAMFFLYMWRYAGIPVRDLFFLFEGYTAGFHGYTVDELIHFNNAGQCVYFVCLVMLQWGNILAVRNRRMSIVQADPFTRARRNPWLGLGMAMSLGIAVFVTEVPGIQSLFNTASVPLEFWLIPIPLGVGILCVDEMRKLLVRLFPKGPLARIAW
ncbi:sodium/potassium-transporting ATPase subunit alpha [Sporothrix brasiliensis 5110]|uniref:Sodium/potassium-transporting ATPase subunit alpha n=1 Tax=Sporothrix brasiliensis 5110 TaxID=1398154 RepID=A0A0C2ISY2_9PEZI|nr:sodium/potassium-transporting ATPase subunit alpha [Sporothrix brasiliensis 5110]KIH92131.1 sodium/potassium-transporting ATPase subunit alpha [Sporothrix brasiliensis 5110]